MAKRKQTPEGSVLSAVMDYLTAQKILHFRMNTGAIKVGNRMVRFGTKGMADVLAFPWYHYQPFPLWIECKAKDGKISPEQKEFETRVVNDGHDYCVVHNVEELIEAMARYV